MTNPPRPALTRSVAFFLFALVVVTWGINWTVTKTIVHSVPPLWTTAIRCGIATCSLFCLLVTRRQLIVPRRGDLPVILVITLFHMVAYSTLAAAGLQVVSVGRSVVLGYTTPLWVAPELGCSSVNESGGGRGWGLR
jgi:drug/metabolite transporter (DMT)-like permease